MIKNLYSRPWAVPHSYVLPESYISPKYYVHRRIFKPLKLCELGFMPAWELPCKWIGVVGLPCKQEGCSQSNLTSSNIYVF